jgi:flagellin-specific chaperone FliS
MVAKQLSIPFTYLYNISFETGIVPDVLKISRITPIYKNGTCTDPFNYRPISILSPFSKILEKLMYEQLISFIEKYKILYEYQFGFRKGYSTEQAILEITDNLRNYLDNNQIVCGLFLDLSKAFDTVNHDILLAKMDKYGIRGEPLTWFKNYLSNRKQYVKIGCTESELLEMTCGVPQGSTLGPLLFLLYTNDMPNCAKKLSFRIFADGTNVFYSCKNLSNLESTMNEQFKLIRNYCAINKLSINFQKTHYMVISSTRKKLKDIKIANIEQKGFIKYLGIFLDEHINWKQQIKRVNNKIAKNIGIINKLRHYLDLRMIKQLYYTLIYPYLTYGVMSWGNTYKSSLTKISTKQNKCLRNMFFAYSRESATPYYNLMEILKFENIFKLKIAEFSYKIVNGRSNIPSIFLEFVRPAYQQHSYNTRFASDQRSRQIMESTLFNLLHQKYGSLLT